jgi:serine/threonine protein kinase
VLEGFCTNCGARKVANHAGEPACPQCGSRPGGYPEALRPWLGVTPAGLYGIRYADGVVVAAGGRVLEEGEAAPERLVQVPHRSTDVRMRIGAYDILDQLGRGAMGVVYRAYSLRLRRTCAVKVLTGGEHSSDLEILRFQNEAMLAGRLDHPNIVRIFDAGEDRGLYFFVMEYIESRPFSAWMGRTGDESLREGLRILVQVARALDHAHRQGIVHRDVKPDNILVDPDGVPHVSDFGIAKTLDQDTGMTYAGRPVGTPWYMPPEQANGELNSIGPLSDVYSLGATMYHLLAGAPPFAGDQPLIVMMDVIRKEPERPSEAARRTLGRILSPDLETICLKAMEKDAARRYPSAATFADDIDAWLAGHPVSVRPPTPVERVRKRIEGSRPVLAAAAVLVSSVVLLTIAFGAVVLFNLDRTNASLREFGRRAGEYQAETLDRALRAAMLEERPQVARTLVNRIRHVPGLTSLEVLRPDGSPAWEGPSPTLGAGAAADANPPPAVVPHPVLQRLKISPETWASVLAGKRVVVRDEELDSEHVLTVMRPLVNETVCRACHQGVPEDDILAVLVSRQSLADVEMRIRNNQKITAIVGGSTAVILAVMLYVLSRMFGIGVRPRVFGRRAGAQAGVPGSDTLVEDRPAR